MVVGWLLVVKLLLPRIDPGFLDGRSMLEIVGLWCVVILMLIFLLLILFLFSWCNSWNGVLLHRFLIILKSFAVLLANERHGAALHIYSRQNDADCDLKNRSL